MAAVKGKIKFVLEVECSIFDSLDFKALVPLAKQQFQEKVDSLSAKDLEKNGIIVEQMNG